MTGYHWGGERGINRRWMTWVQRRAGDNLHSHEKKIQIMSVKWMKPDEWTPLSWVSKGCYWAPKTFLTSRSNRPPNSLSGSIVQSVTVWGWKIVPIRTNMECSLDPWWKTLRWWVPVLISCWPKLKSSVARNSKACLVYTFTASMTQTNIIDCAQQ